MFIDEDPPNASEVKEPNFSRDLFLEWRSPRRGADNPQQLTNPVWVWLAETGLDPYQATQKLNGPSAIDAGPGWTLRRFGQSSTKLADGRELLIAGEHEDSYDPDFFIYNDVIIREPGGHIKIYGYPVSSFPPTDFHSATLVGNRILIIGSLGYQGERHVGLTPIYSLDLITLKISAAQASGEAPGWIHKHNASLGNDGRSILVTHGIIDRGGNHALTENIDDWRLDLVSMRWERLTKRNWQRWSFSRRDGETNKLWQIRSAGFYKQFPEVSENAFASMPDSIRSILRDQMKAPDSTADIQTLYSPLLPHQKIPDREEESNVHRIVIDDVTIRYVEGFRDVQMTIEGQLPPNIVDQLKQALRETLSALEQTEYVITAID